MRSSVKWVIGIGCLLAACSTRPQEPQPIAYAPPAEPDVTITALSDRRVNLYLFKVSENGHLKNQEIPGHGHPAQYGRPPLSLNLHYLLTTHVGAETTEDADLQCQAMLGDAIICFAQVKFELARTGTVLLVATDAGSVPATVGESLTFWSRES